MEIKNKFSSLENKIGVINISYLVVLIIGMTIACCIGTREALFFVGALPALLWIIIPYTIVEIVEWRSKLKPDGWLMAVQAVWDY